MNAWQIAFTVLQIVLVFALGWFIKLLASISHKYNELEKRVYELEKKDAVVDERIGNILEKVTAVQQSLENFIKKIEQKLGVFV